MLLAAGGVDGEPRRPLLELVRMFATWASRQAGKTIRGEDLLDELQRELGRDAKLLHPIASVPGRSFAAGCSSATPVSAG